MSVKMVFLTGTLVVAGIVADGGIIGVRVHEKKPDGTNLRLYVPAVLVPLGVKLAPERELERALRHAKEFLPAVRIAAEELERIPDGLLVEVRSPREYVLVEKRGGYLVVDVDNERETVHVSVPLKMVRQVARNMEARALRANSTQDSQDKFPGRETLDTPRVK
ncbi:MAG: hypothetical protein M1453_13215 [Acidobacteria bacterium]|nr:hypothetical protein [Acidobacteriota bacterium]MCL5288937.1 hypothetical protein [Acidobacteriota bacterium]